MGGVRETLQVSEHSIAPLNSGCHGIHVVFCFSVAPPLANKMDAIQFMSNLAGNFEGVVQYNKDNTQFEVEH